MEAFTIRNNACGPDTHIYTHAHTNTNACTCTTRTGIDPLIAIPNRVACSSYYHHFHHNNYQHQHDNGRFECVVGQNPTSRVLFGCV